MGRRTARRRWLRMRYVVLALAVAFAVAGAGFQVADAAHQQNRALEADRLAAQRADSGEAPSPAPTSSAPTRSAQSSSAPVAPVPSPHVPSPTAGNKLVLPPTKFAWPAAGISVNVLPLAWSQGETVDPPLDANGFDPVAHWLAGTGTVAGIKPVVLAAHSCHEGVPLCNDSTFPFNRLSYPGWTQGQTAIVTGANGLSVPCTLADRRLVDKSRAFSFANDPCTVVVFSCNFENPDSQVVLLTFRCGQCT